MSVYVLILQESPVLLWGLTSRQRLKRVLERVGVKHIVEDLTSVPEQATILLLRGDHLYDDRVIKNLVRTPNVILQLPEAEKLVTVAAHVSSRLVPQARDVLETVGRMEGLPGVRVETPATLSSSYERRLRKVDQPFVLQRNYVSQHLPRRSIHSLSNLLDGESVFSQ